MINEVVYVLIWWLFFLIIGIISIPLCSIFFGKFRDQGYGFSKTVGLLTISYTAFLASIFKILPFESIVLYLLVAVYFSINLFIYNRNRDSIRNLIKTNLGFIIFEEIFFSLGFLFWTWVRGHNPDINGLEKFMDYGFINSILKSTFLPPSDMWYAGGTINYYWFGHFYTAVATKITGIPSDFTYNLMIATIAGLTLSGVFSVVSTLASVVGSKTNKRTVFIAGIISALLVTFAGNFHTPFYAIKNGVEKYWYPDATRFVGYNPETNDKTIHEFPLYSFVVSDLHGHLLNLPFVLLYIALLLALVTSEKFNSQKKSDGFGIFPGILPLGFLLGIMFMTSTWDFGNYLVLTGIVNLVFNMRFYRKFNFQFLFKSATVLVTILLLGLVFTSPFILHFKSIAEGIDFVKAHTPLWQLAILWGFPALLAMIFSGILIKDKKNLTKSDFFVLSLLITSFILIFLPEVIYVKDIYVATHHRANTMFKLTYQAFVMSYLTAGYVSIRLLSILKNYFAKTLIVIFFSLIFGSILWYPNFAIKSYYGNLKNYQGLSGETWLGKTNPGIFKTILWFRKNVKRKPTILEAPGDSYTEANVISSYTGLPTLLGWFVHEWLWRGSSDVPQKRGDEVSQIYTSGDLSQTKKLLKKYNVEYIIVGSLELQKYPQINLAKITQITTLVYQNEDTSVYKVRSF